MTFSELSSEGICLRIIICLYLYKRRQTGSGKFRGAEERALDETELFGCKVPEIY